ncbi:MAG TPA: SpoIIE family protein phosphatase [Thermoanaerobaculia bacterium]|nr:SpoIIE family protein phosphatase [Thermoanaerobaculia bacterium]
MSARNRFVLIFVITLAVAGAGFGYLAGRIVKWHSRGWTGVNFYPEMPQTPSKRGSRQASQSFGAEAGEILMVYGGSPADGRLRAYDRIVSVNGIRIQELKRLRELGERLPGGATVTYRVRRGGALLDVPVRLGTPLRSPYIVVKSLMAVVVAVIFIAVALIVFVRRPDDERATVFYAFALVSAMAVLGSAATVYEAAGGRGVAPTFGFSSAGSVFFIVVAVAYAPLVLHLALIFPRRRPILERNPHVIRWIYAFAVMTVLLLLALAWTFMAMFENPGSNPAYDAGFAVGRSSRYFALAIFLIFLQIAYAGRKEGLLAAFARRPVRSLFVILGLFFATTVMIGHLGPRQVGMVAGLLMVVGPMLALASYPILAAVALVRSYRSAGVEEKRQVQWPLWGLIIAVSAKVFAFLVAMAGGIALSLWHRSAIEYRLWFQTLDIVPMLVSLLIPISFAAAILKYRLMNIDVIIRKTVVYAILSGAILLFYVGLVGGLGTLLVAAAGLQNQTLVIASTLIVAVLFVPVRNKLQTLVDRNLFRHRYDYPEALRAITIAARNTADTPEFLTIAAEKLQQALQNRAIVIFVERQDDLVAVAKVGVSDKLLGRLRVPRSFIELLDRPFDPRRRNLPEQTAAALARVETALVVPTGSRGFIAAAPKLSGGDLDVEDIDFIRLAADQIGNAIDRIRMQVEEADFAQARAIQQTLLPREMPRIAKLDVSGIWQPARTMGGDYYDLLKLGESELAVCIGDVAGKGMPAALLMSGLQAAVRASASNSPRDLCERVRRVVVSSLSGGRFVTFFYATIDTASMTLRWCNAGHNAPILARADGSVIRLEEGGPAISRLFRDTPYTERELALQPGDRLVLFTDGVSEAMDLQGELFGEQRIEELVTDARNLGAHELQRTIVDASTSFSGGEIEDDVTLVVVGVAA